MLAVAMIASALCACPSLARADSVYVKYRGWVDLKSFDCTDIARSSYIRRVCYDEANEYMLINLNGAYYHHCAIDDGTVSALRAADSMGRFYIAGIKGKADFDCRKNRVPEYYDEAYTPASLSLIAFALLLFLAATTSRERKDA
jgi:hypothetical protein